MERISPKEYIMTKRDFTKKTRGAAATFRKEGWIMILIKFTTKEATRYYGNELGLFLNDYDDYTGSLEFHFSSIIDLDTFIGKVNYKDIDWMYAA